jgi:hypothetical protein
MIGFPRRHLAPLQELASRVLERRGADSAPATLARDLLDGFFDVCTRTGQDGVLVELAAGFGLPEVTDGSGLSEEPRLHDALAAMLGDKARFDRGGPRSTMPAQLTDCLLATLTLELRDASDRSVTLGDELRREVIAAIAGVVEVELTPDKLRPAIIADARARCEPQHWKAFDKMAAQLDERGARLPQQMKVPLDTVQAVQRALFDARFAIVERVANEAIDRARPILEREHAELAARLDQPITHRLTPREVARRRAAEVATPAPELVVRALLTGLSEMLEVTWTAPTAIARPYGVSQTFAVGELVEHPKFGRGVVKVVTLKDIEVEFDDGPHRLVHARK